LKDVLQNMPRINHRYSEYSKINPTVGILRCWNKNEIGVGNNINRFPPGKMSALTTPSDYRNVWIIITYSGRTHIVFSFQVDRRKKLLLSNNLFPAFDGLARRGLKQLEPPGKFHRDREGANVTSYVLDFSRRTGFTPCSVSVNNLFSDWSV